MKSQLKVMMVEDVVTDAELATRELSRAGMTCDVLRVDTPNAFLKGLEEFEPDIILSDYAMPEFDGLSALKLAHEKSPATPFIFVSGTIGEEVAIESLKRGAADYVLKHNLGRLSTAVQRALQDKQDRLAREKVERELKETQERFALFMRHLPGAAFMKDPNGRYHFVNETWEQMTGLTYDQVVGRNDGDLWPNIAAQYATNDEWVIANNQVLETIETFPQKDGVHSFLMHKFPIANSDGSPILMGGIGVDFTARLAAEQKVARLSRIHSFMSGINSTIVRVHDRADLLHDACRIAVDHGGFKLAWVGIIDQTSGKAQQVAKVGRPSSLSAGAMRSIKELGADQGIVSDVIHGDGPVVINDLRQEQSPLEQLGVSDPDCLALVGLPLRVEGETIGALVLHAEEAGVFDQEEMKLLEELAGDISFALEYIQKKERLDYFAYYDEGTGLPNRMLFSERVNQAARSSPDLRMGILMLDLERFAIINDTLGRQAGDKLLKLIAESLRQAVGGTHHLARVGGDTFAIGLSDIHAATDILHILDTKIFKALCRPFLVDGQELRLAFKCGVALLPSDGSDAESLLKNAETALKKAKYTGDKYKFYAPQMNARVAEVLSLENRLRVALAHKQFVLHYQPSIDLKSGEMIGMEALLRWNNPELGLVQPATFIPILEETGMILDVGKWVLKQVLADYQRWVGEGLHPPRIAVNVSALQLRQKDFADIVEEVFTQGAPGAFRLDLEITESVLMEDIERRIPLLRKIKDMGVGIAIDDFGTGYSSLSYLAKLPATALKIDRMFIESMVTESDSMAIVSAIISLAHSLNLRVIAEGVETTEQSHLLKLLKCDEIQGYLMDKPMVAEKVVELFSNADHEEKMITSA